MFHPATGSGPTHPHQIFDALGNATRLALIERLRAEGALSTRALAEDTPMTRQAVTKHLTVLEDAGLVRGVKDGRERLWALDARPMAEAARWLEGYRALWEARLDRLGQHLRQPNGP